MKIFSTEQIRKWDAYTIQHEPIASVDLMERASRCFVKWFKGIFHDRKKKVYIFCGPGNNGGDGLAVARLLSQDHYNVSAYLLSISKSFSPDCESNYKRLQKSRSCPLIKLDEGCELPKIEEEAILVDAIFGSGLSRPIEGFWKSFIIKLNDVKASKVAIDIPSGMFSDSPTTNISFQSDFTFSFEIPKLGFFFRENQDRVGEWHFGSIGLHPKFKENENAAYFLITEDSIKKRYRPRQKFSHKGTYGHALLMAGSYGAIGAAILAAKAALRSGVGLLTVHVPKCGYEIMQASVPEAMVLPAEEYGNIIYSDIDFSKYTSVGIGCGMGQREQTKKALDLFLQEINSPVVLDAEALNIIGSTPKLFDSIPKNSILTPHPKEFERLFGKTSNSFARLDLLREKSAELGIIIVLKGAHTAIACPDGSCHFNNTGNPGMATGGSGDVLTGIITGLLAQGYSPKSAAIMGVYLHGLAGDLAAAALSEESMTAGDIVQFLGEAFSSIN